MDDRGFKLISKKEAQEYLKKNPPHSPSLIDDFFIEGMAIAKLSDKLLEKNQTA